MDIVFNVVLTTAILSFVLWISKTNPVLGGFVVSLPISTLIVLAISRIQNGDTGNNFILAKSIFIAIPSTLVFFIPFLVADKFKLSFWASYSIGFALLIVSFFTHKWVMDQWAS